MSICKQSLLLACLAVGTSMGCDEAVSSLVKTVVTCNPGETKCENGSLSVCAAIGWQSTPCPAECSADGKSCKIPEGQECAVDICDGSSTLKRCVNGKYEPMPCPSDKPVCQGMACMASDASCIEGNAVCDGEKVLKTCGNDGKWHEEQCPTDKPVCKANGEKSECTASNPTGETECNAANNDKKCSEDRMSLFSCGTDNKWGESVACEPGKKCDPVLLECRPEDVVNQCAKGEKKCEGTDSIIGCTDDNQWGEAIKCPEATPVCKANGDSAECVPEQASECKAVCEGEKIKNCDENGNLLEAEACPNGQACQQAEGAPAACADIKCAPGTKECTNDNKAVKTCGDDGKWVVEDCKGDKVCDIKKLVCEDPGSAVVCTAGTKKCDGNDKYFVCNDKGQWDSASKKCDDKTPMCLGEDGAADCFECKAGDLKCENHRAYVCGADNKWDKGTPCTKSEQCSETTHKCENVSHECTPGTMKCSDADTDPNQYFECGKDGKWETTAKHCPTDKPACSGDPGMAVCKEKGASIGCTPGTMKCLKSDTYPNSYLVCGADGKWENETKAKQCLPATPICSGKDGEAKCVACNDGEIKCITTGGLTHNGNIEPGTYVECKDGKWADKTNKCQQDKPICDSDVTPSVCAPICANDARRCSADGMPQLCIKGQWTDQNACGKLEECKGNGECACTKPGATLCDGTGGIKICADNGKWNPKACGNNQTCDPATNQCSEKCKVGDKQCTDDGNFWICKLEGGNNVWTLAAECGAKDQCNDGKGTPGCVCDAGKESKCDEANDNVLSCKEKTLARVTYNAWENTLECDPGMCKAEGKTAYCSCSAGETRCMDSSTLNFCQAGKWIKLDTCTKSETCNESVMACVNYCKSSETKCSGNVLMKCENGIYVQEEVCKLGCLKPLTIAHCNTSDSCINNMKRCAPDGTAVQICKKGKWDNNQVCGNKNEVCVATGNLINPSYDCVTKLCDNLAMGCSKDKTKVTMCLNNKPEEVAECADKAKCIDGKCVATIK